VTGRRGGVRAGRGHRGLRVRIVASFAIGGLLLSSVLAILTFALAYRYLIGQRERNAQRQTFVNARVLRDELTAGDADPAAALASLELPSGSTSVMRGPSAWYATSVAAGRDSIPESLRQLVGRGDAGHQRITTRNGPALVIGVPLPSVHATYFEVTSLHELSSTLAVIRNSLLGAALATTLAAGILGLWAGRRVLRPLREVSDAATEIAGGALTRRIESDGDPDLDPIIRSFNHMVDALHERIRRDARFASDVSHELRSPLTTLHTTADVLERRAAQLDEPVREPIALLVAEVQRFERLVAELLELARAEAGVEELALEPVNIGELVLHAVATTDEPEFVIDIDPELARHAVLTDKRRLNRVLVNLLDNARTHGLGVAAVHARLVGPSVELAVEDRGPGVAPEDRAQIFERFRRGAAAGRRGGATGTGLGLSLVAEHVRLLGGEVRVEGGPDGRGARFVVSIPDRRA
jgi:signal transduction histidine kinase